MSQCNLVWATVLAVIMLLASKYANAFEDKKLIDPFGISDSANDTNGGIPGQPHDGEIVATTSMSITLNWVCDHIEEDVWFELELSIDGSQFTMWDDDIPATCEQGSRIDPDYRIQGLQSQTDYHIRVAARSNKNGINAQYSGVSISATTDVTPQTEIIDVLLGLASADLSWELVVGKAHKMQLRHLQSLDNPLAGLNISEWPIVEDDIDPDNKTIHLDEEFDTDVYNSFVMLPFEDLFLQEAGTHSGNQNIFIIIPADVIAMGFTTIIIIAVLVTVVVLAIIGGVVFLLHKRQEKDKDCKLPCGS